MLQLENPAINEIEPQLEQEPTGAAIVEIPNQLNSKSTIPPIVMVGCFIILIPKNININVIGGYSYYSGTYNS